MTVQGTKPSQDCCSHHRWSRHFAEHHTAANGLPQDQEEKRGTDVSEPGGQMHMRESLYPNYETHHLTWMDIWCHKTRLWQQKISGINFLCLSKITYDTKTMMLVSYYQRYWAHIFQNVSHGRDIIHLDNDRAPANNKVIGPAFENYIIYNVIKGINPRLQDYVQTNYHLKMRAGRRVPDVKLDVFSNTTQFLEEIQ